MTMQEAMWLRHTVRRYTDQRIPEEVRDRLTRRIQTHNQARGLSLKLVTDSGDAFGPLLRLVLAKGVRNYIVLTGPDRPETGEAVGYSGADLMLFAQTLGLNTWWVGGTYSRSGVGKHVPEGERLLGLIAVGYGASQGKPHKSRRPEEIAAYDGEWPDWFAAGVEAVLLAPTALNRQAFTIRGSGTREGSSAREGSDAREGSGARVFMTCDNGAFSGVDLGIGKYHFELGAGRERFAWATGPE